MNSFVVSAVLLLAAGAMAQYRPFYAGNGVVYPRPFVSEGDDGLGNRGAFGTTENVPRTDGHGFDTVIVQDTANLPREQQPFWFINRGHIATHIGLNPQAGSAASAPAAPTATAAAAANAGGRPVIDLVEPVQVVPVVDPAVNTA